MFNLKLYSILCILINTILTYPTMSIKDILSLESISCVTDNECPNALICKNNYCQYPTYFCLGNNTCIEENKTNNILYPIQDNSKPEENKLKNFNPVSSLIFESCHPNNENCHTRPCFKNSDCFSNNCEVELKRCLLNKSLPLYHCINKEQGGMICNKFMEENYPFNGNCFSQSYDTLSNPCNPSKKNVINNNNNNNRTLDEIIQNIDNEMEQVKEENKNIDHITIIKEVLLLIFVILPIVIFTQFLKSTKYVKNIKRNRKTFEYKSVLVDSLSAC
ncbi:hypothetical protein BCR36DRAFT_408653 [Piromyces finnis]|uniref:Dickkopf N-terminal cysteine-rich domain-containing protein n=1 Tax=Piromyces finnis TaxID=1754191 RepID=A0A1Y1VKY3_9FUNG|nr:hypothetical protein BCR36DRAFT_408653 [Piromyces finnis]|eukprot:ORX59127.1 hypothetical protein BCR36DRAFT_408653 [Piromyces finnis]